MRSMKFQEICSIAVLATLVPALPVWGNDNGMDLFRAGMDRFREQKFAEAKELLIKADRADKASGNTNAQWIGECCLRLGQYSQAEKYFNTAVKEAKEICKANKEDMSIGLASCMLGLGNVYEHTKRTDAAESLYKDVAAKVDKMEADSVQRIASPQAFDALAQFLDSKGDSKGAEQWWQKVASMRVSAHAFSTQADALDHYAAMLRRQKRDKDAAPLENRARDLRGTQNNLNRKGLDY